MNEKLGIMNDKKVKNRSNSVEMSLKDHAAFSNGQPFNALVPNLIASIMGQVAVETAEEQAGDSIDRGLILLRKLNEAGLDVSWNKK